MEVISVFCISLLVVLLFQWIARRKKILNTFERLGIPGPKPSFWTGNIKQLLEHPTELELTKTYGHIFGIYYGLNPVLVVTDPDLLKIVQVKEAQNFHRRNPLIPTAAVPEDLFATSQVLIHGPRWKQSRDSTTPAFTTSKLKMATTRMNEVLDDHLSELAIETERDKTVNVTQISNRLLVDIIFQTLFGAKISRNDKNKLDHLVNSLHLAFSTNVLNSINYMSLCFPELKSLLHFCRRTADKFQYFWNLGSAKYAGVLCNKIILSRMSLTMRNQFSDVLQIMMNKIYPSEEKGKSQPIESSNTLLSYEDLLSNTYYMAIASSWFLSEPVGAWSLNQNRSLSCHGVCSICQTTIQTSVLYSLYHAAKDPECQNRLREEIFNFSGKGEDLDYNKLSDMKYLDQVYSEVLRLHPPVPYFINRVAEKDYTYKNMLIPKDMTIFIPQLGTLRNPEYWTEPEEFRPERFKDKASINPYVYQPFGVGPRHCTGIRLGQLIGKLILARFVKSFDMKLVESKQEELEADVGFVILRPKDTLYLKLTPI